MSHDHTFTVNKYDHTLIELFRDELGYQYQCGYDIEHDVSLSYAMMNFLSVFASFTEWTKNHANNVDGYQRRVSKRVYDIIAEQQKRLL